MTLIIDLRICPRMLLNQIILFWSCPIAKVCLSFLSEISAYWRHRRGIFYRLHSSDRSLFLNLLPSISLFSSIGLCISGRQTSNSPEIWLTFILSLCLNLIYLQGPVLIGNLSLFISRRIKLFSHKIILVCIWCSSSLITFRSFPSLRRVDRIERSFNINSITLNQNRFCSTAGADSSLILLIVPILYYCCLV